jgi:nucleoside-diphosphate-sugar epimerase
MGNVLVTGGAGFIGSHLVEALVNDGYSVLVIDNLSTGKRSNVHPQAEFLQADVSCPYARGFCEGIDTVFHMAASVSVVGSIEAPLANQENGEKAALNMLLGCRNHKVRRFVMSSSCSVYGDGLPLSLPNPLPQTESLPLNPLSPYAVSKLASEAYCRAFSACHGMDTVVLRYFNVFGPRQDPRSMYAGVIPIFVEKIGKGEAPTIYGDGLQTRDFVFVGNVVKANMLAMKSERCFRGEAFNVGCGKAVSVVQVAAKINELLGTSVQPVFAPARPGEARHSLACIDKARNVLGYDAPVGFEDGMKVLLGQRG